jgi:hypothetical protein
LQQGRIFHAESTYRPEIVLSQLAALLRLKRIWIPGHLERRSSCK